MFMMIVLLLTNFVFIHYKSVTVITHINMIQILADHDTKITITFISVNFLWFFVSKKNFNFYTQWKRFCKKKKKYIV